MSKLTLKWKLALMGALLIPCFGRMALHGTGNEGELYRYLVPFIIGCSAGFSIGYLAEMLLRKNRELKLINEKLEREVIAHQESDQRYEALFEQNHSIILLVDPESGMIVDANPCACDFYGYSLAELRQMKISQINTLPEKVLRTMMHEVAKDERKKFYFTHRIASGKEKEVEVYSGSIMLDGKKYLLSLINDISELQLLRDIIPICASCKQIRDDSGYWRQIETYLDEHTDMAFSHGICPACMEKLYPEIMRGQTVSRLPGMEKIPAEEEKRILPE